MLDIINPFNMSMNMPCCPYAPYCSHNPHGQRQIHNSPLPPLSLGSGGESALWGRRLPTHHESQYNYARSSQTPLFPSQTLNYLNDQDKLRTASQPYSASSQSASWTSPSYPILNHDYTSDSWLHSRNKESIHAPGSSTFSHGSSDYHPTMKYESLSLRDVSPSRATDFSTISASSHPSPAPPNSFASYSNLAAPRDDSPFLSSRPLPPEHIRAIETEARRMSAIEFDSESPSRRSRSRSRKGSEAIHCQICHKSFDRRSNFKSHWETHDKDRQRTMCKMEGCQKTFGRPAEMTRHVNSAHRQKSFPCSSCGKEFTRHDILLRHCKDACPVLVKGKGTTRKRRSKAS